MAKYWAKNLSIWSHCRRHRRRVRVQRELRQRNKMEKKNLETHFLCLKENWRNDWFGQIDFNWNKNNLCNYWTKKLDRTRTVVVVKWSPCSPSTLTKPVRILLKPLVLIMSKYLKKTKKAWDRPVTSNLEQGTLSVRKLTSWNTESS